MQNEIIVDIIEDDINKLDKKLLATLLIDRTTRKNILWGTKDYAEYGRDYAAGEEIQIRQITGSMANVIQPRVMKAYDQKKGRTREKAEVFTPSWICNKQNNLIDEQWFGAQDIFNISVGDTWQSISTNISFEKNGKKTWKKYVDAKRLEVSCGEAPYLVSRYDSVTGRIIPVKERIGLLDRKLRIVDENTSTKEEWKKWAKRAVESIYGYEFHGDSLLLARENVLYTYIEYYSYRFDEEPDINDLQDIALVISWNLWQMDGFNYAVPYCETNNGLRQMNIFDYMTDIDVFDYSELVDTKGQALCKIRDWRSKETLFFRDVVGGGVNE